MNDLKAKLRRASKVAVLTGAGVSAESGIATFRGSGGLWRSYRPEDLANPQAYARNPDLVWDWYFARFKRVVAATPNDAHLALASLAQQKDLTLVTQNVDGLHLRAGSDHVLELHGNLTKSRCEACKHLDELSLKTSLPPKCSRCGSRARPNVVWFGEMLSRQILDEAVSAFSSADMALIIGTSAVVEPAASLARMAKAEGAFVLEINPEATPLSHMVDAHLAMLASAAMRALLS